VLRTSFAVTDGGLFFDPSEMMDLFIVELIRLGKITALREKEGQCQALDYPSLLFSFLAFWSFEFLVESTSVDSDHEKKTKQGSFHGIDQMHSQW